MNFSCYALSALAVGAVATSSLSADAETITLKVLGQPNTGLIQKEREQVFFESFGENTGLDAVAEYSPLDMTGIKDTEQLRILKAGLFDIVSLRMSQVSRDEPAILGLDLVGLNPTYEAGKAHIEAFESYVDERLQEKFNTKLLGVWPYGPQVLFCKPEISQLSDLSGYKVRVYDQSLANFVSSVGGTPVPLSFTEVYQSLQKGVVDCAITGPSSANTAGWPEIATHVLPLGFQIAINGYAINLDKWNALDAEQQKLLQAGIDTLVDDIWTFSQELFDDAVRCNVGEEPCETVTKFDLVNVPITEGDLDLVANAVSELSFPAWAEICDAANPGCSEAWKASIGPMIGME